MCVALTSWWSRLRELLFLCASVRVSRAEGSASGRECRLDSSRTPPRRSAPRPDTWVEEEDEEDEDEDEEVEVGALGTGLEFQSDRGRLGGAGGSLSPGVQGKGRLWSRPSGPAPVAWGRSGGGGGGRSRSAGGRGRGLSL